jgi:hypothetical protein
MSAHSKKQTMNDTRNNETPRAIWRLGNDPALARATAIPPIGLPSCSNGIAAITSISHRFGEASALRAPRGSGRGIVAAQTFTGKGRF